MRYYLDGFIENNRIVKKRKLRVILGFYYLA